MCVFSSSCKDKKKDQMQNINQNVEITDESNFYEIVIEATTIEVWSGPGKRSQWIISSFTGLLEGFNLKIDHIKWKEKEDI